jgi:hypothetical protein
MTHERYTIVNVTGDVDFHSSRWLQEHLLRFLQRGGTPTGGEPVPGDVHRLPRPAHAPRHLPKAEERACSIRFSELSSPVQRVAELTGQREAIPMAGPPASQGRPPRDVSVASCAMPPPARVASG